MSKGISAHSGSFNKNENEINNKAGLYEQKKHGEKATHLIFPITTEVQDQCVQIVEAKRQKKIDTISADSGHRMTVSNKDIIAIIADVNEAAINNELESLR